MSGSTVRHEDIVRSGTVGLASRWSAWRTATTHIGARPTSHTRCPVNRLTPRQREVLALMAAGWSNAAIARSLVISEKAVVQHTSQIYDRLDLAAADDSCHRRVVAVVQYLSGAA
jgi:DNA-binding NarL/FixJ family response regulator